VWLEATGTNRLSDPAINGIVVNSRDITERRKADKEARMRGQMQALSENSPDLITRFNKEGRVFYINPIIESYSGHQKEAFFQKQLDELTLEPGVVENWKNILQTVLTSQEKVSAEMDFPSSVGNRVMQVNAIPEYNDQSVVESVLFVSHDITERKMAELEIQSKNRKITESINYAKRIQGAILPNNEIIKAGIPRCLYPLQAPRRGERRLPVVHAEGRRPVHCRRRLHRPRRAGALDLPDRLLPAQQHRGQPRRPGSRRNPGPPRLRRNAYPAPGQL
jgi:PAS domain S-box-containing protein